MTFSTNYQFIDWSDLPEVIRERPRPPARSALSAPMVIGDAMAPVQAMTDGTWHDSKSGIRANYKRYGVTEVGNDPQRLKPRERARIDRRAVKQSLERATARFNRGERAS